MKRKINGRNTATKTRKTRSWISGTRQSSGTDEQDHRVAGLLSDLKAITAPDYHWLNRNTKRNDRLLHAVLCAYAKHQLDCEEIGWDALGDILMNVICNEIGDDAFIAWGEMVQGSAVGTDAVLVASPSKETKD